MKTFLALERAALGVLGLMAYQIVAISALGYGWWLFAALILAPDIAFAFYLFGPRIGAIGYNILHSWTGPVALVAAAWLAATPVLAVIAIVWFTHIGFDRALGYGLKYETGFADTHLGRIGKA